MDKKPGKILFCYTVVKSFAPAYEVDAARAFIEDIKHDGATAEAIEALRHTQTANWITDDESGHAIHAVEIIRR
jgi:hypothetical protein